MRNTIITAAVIALTLSNAAKADGLMGFGAYQCNTIIEDFKKHGDIMPLVIEQWVSGFYTGLNVGSADAEYREFSIDNVTSIGPALKTFCASHPNDQPALMIARTWKALPRANGG
jgi:hypothetical protein